MKHIIKRFQEANVASVHHNGHILSFKAVQRFVLNSLEIEIIVTLQALT